GAILIAVRRYRGDPLATGGLHHRRTSGIAATAPLPVLLLVEDLPSVEVLNEFVDRAPLRVVGVGLGLPVAIKGGATADHELVFGARKRGDDLRRVGRA